MLIFAIPEAHTENVKRVFKYAALSVRIKLQIQLNLGGLVSQNKFKEVANSFQALTSGFKWTD